METPCRNYIGTVIGSYEYVHDQFGVLVRRSACPHAHAEVWKFADKKQLSLQYPDANFENVPSLELRFSFDNNCFY